MAEQAPDFLTVTETAKVLRIRRTAAYQLVNHDLETGGADGLRARRFGRQIRVTPGRTRAADRRAARVAGR